MSRRAFVGNMHQTATTRLGRLAAICFGTTLALLLGGALMLGWLASGACGRDCPAGSKTQDTILATIGSGLLVLSAFAAAAAVGMVILYGKSLRERAKVQD